MKTIIFRTSTRIFILTIMTAVLLGGCSKFSEQIHDKTTGMNGSFEVVKSGLPVNWLIYTPKTVPTGDYDLIIDTAEYKDGKQSLKFLVRECSSAGGWYSPGLCQEYNATPGETYKVSFWVKNKGSEFHIKIGGVSAFEGQYDTVVTSGELIPDWKLYEHEYKMPMEFETIRIELNVLKPGSFWIDDIKIEGINDKSE